MHTVFNSISEYLDELGKDVPDRKIVRLTNLYETREFSPITKVSVLSTYTVKGHLVRYEQEVGSYIKVDEKAAERTEELAEGVQKSINTRCEELGFEVRAGFIKE